MGLCKCPKKKVTNLFCYEHRVNVCQYCMVKHHSKCIVQSYLLWLQDSDYNPNCVLCSDKLVKDECVRLVCLHIFHWKCLDSKCRLLPSTTAPAGFKCPICGEPIFPLANVAIPVADYLRDKLSTVNWARIALGLPTSSESASQDNDELKPLLNSTNDNDDNHTPKAKDDLIVFMDETVYSRPEESAQLPRRLVSHTPSTRFLVNQEDEIKDRRGNPLLQVLRYFWRRIKNFGRNRYGPCKFIILGILGFTLLFTMLTILGNIVTDNDPMFDPINNPHVHMNKGPS